MNASRRLGWMLLLFVLSIAIGRSLPLHSHSGGAHEHGGEAHRHHAEIHAHDRLLPHADAIDVGGVAGHEIGVVDLQQELAGRLAAATDELPDAALPLSAFPLTPVVRLAGSFAFPGPALPCALRPPPHRGEARAPPVTA